MGASRTCELIAHVEELYYPGSHLELVIKVGQDEDTAKEFATKVEQFLLRDAND